MKITSISQQQTRKDRYSISVDGEYRFSLSEGQLSDSGLRSGDEVGQEQMDEFIRQSELGKALDKAYRFLSYRSRSQREVAIHLRGKNYDPTMVDEAIGQLKAQNLLDDVRFAEEWISERQLLNPRSRMELKIELRRKGINSEAIEEALAAYTAEYEVEAITDLITQKKLRHRYSNERKLQHYLSAKGYSADAIRRAIKFDE